MPAKLDRCVKDVKGQGKSEDSAWAICNDQLKENLFGETHNPLDIPFGHEVNEGGPGSGRKSTGAHGVVPGQLPPVKTPKAKPSKPSSAITPMGRGKTSSSAGRVNETEEDLCEKCGKTRADHGMFSDHDFESELEEMSEEEEDVEIKSIKIDFVTESFSIGGGLSAQSVGGKKHKFEEIEACPCFDSLHRALKQ